MNGYEEAEYVVGEISRAHRENGAKYKDLSLIHIYVRQMYIFLVEPPGQMHGQVKPLKVDRKYMWQHRSSRFHCLQEMVTNLSLIHISGRTYPCGNGNPSISFRMDTGKR